MQRPVRWSVFALLLAGCAAPAGAPPSASPAPAAATLQRPVANPVVPPRGFREAVAAGTRSATGAPGPRYWQQRASYTIRSRLDTRAKRVAGAVQIRYDNRSPDTLSVLYLHLHQNLHAPGVIRNEPQEVTGGVTLDRVAVNGAVLPGAAGGGPGYRVNGTLLQLRPSRPVLPGASATIDVEWSFVVPQSGAGRMGWDGDNLFFLAYWYPQMAVYDDVGGWHTDPYLGSAEFYMGYADYEFTIDAPAGWVIRATGELQNPAETLPQRVRERLAAAERSDSVVHVLTAADLAAGRATLPGRGGRLQWRFAARNVRDVSFSATRASLWDAARTPVGDRDGSGTIDHARIEALWRPAAPRWRNLWRYAQHSIDFLSRFTGVPYPYPHMTSVEGAGIIGGGMEFPMMTLMGDYTQAGDTALYNVTAHELAHMWVPMIVGTDEKRYGWMDEGTTTFNENHARMEFFPDAADPFVLDSPGYTRTAVAELEGPVMRWTDYHYPGPAGGVASYTKPAVVLQALRTLLGDEVFDRGYRQYLRDWSYRHPTPWDFFAAMERAAGRDLGWFWRSWYYETWLLDQAVESVTTGRGGTVVTVRDLGEVPMPVRLAITRGDGSVERREIPVDPWLAGLRTASVTIPTGSPVVRVEIDPERGFPDANRANNVWTRTEPASSSNPVSP